MARIIDTAAVRIETETERGRREAGAAGEEYGREFARGANRTTQDNPVRPRVNPVEAEFERQVRAAVAQISRRVAVEIPLTTAGEALRQEVARQVREIEATIKADIPTEPEKASAYRAKLAALVRAASETVSARVKTDFDESSFARARRGLLSLIGLGRDNDKTFDGLTNTSKKLGSELISSIGGGVSQFSAMASRVGAVLMAIFALQVAIPAIATGAAAVGGTVVAAIGAATAAAAGFPAVLVSIAAPIAAVKLGMDGIKRAASVLSDEMNVLRSNVNTAFEFTMRPVFERLQAIFPTLTTGLTENAHAVSRLAMDLANVAASEQGINNLRTALAGATVVLDKARPAARGLFEELLNIAGTRGLYVILGDTIAGVTERITAMLTSLRTSGDLERALTGVKGVLFALVDLITKLAEGATKFFIAGAPGLINFINSLSTTLSRVDWTKLGAAFSGMMTRLGSVIERIPPETWQKLADAIGALIEQFFRFAESGGITRLIDDIAGLVKVIAILGGAIQSTEDGLNGLSDSFGSAGDVVYRNVTKPFYDAVKGLFGVNQAVDEQTKKIPETAVANTSSFPQQMTDIFNSAVDSVGAALTRLNEVAQQAIPIFIGLITDPISTIGGLIEPHLSLIGDRVGFYLGYASTQAALGAQQVGINILDWFSKLPDQAGAYFSSLADRAKQSFDDLLANLPARAAQIAVNVIAQLVGFPDSFGSIIGRLVSGADSKFSGLNISLPNYARQAGDSVENAFRDLPGRAGRWAQKTIDDFVNYFKGLPGRLYQEGVNAINSFIDGIKSKAQSIWQAAQDVVSGAIRGAKDALRSGSPSRVFVDEGVNTIDSYIAGLRQRMGPLVNTMKTIMGEAIDAASATIPLPEIASATPNTSNLTDVFSQVRDQLGSALSGLIDLPTLVSALGEVLANAQLTVQGDDLALVYNSASDRLGRR